VRVLAIVFVVLIAALQYPMWLGKGGWLMVRDLKTGFEAIEERARAELGMIRGDEVFFQLQAPGSRTAPAALPAPGK